MIGIFHEGTEAPWNLAMEEYLLEKAEEACFVVWRNEASVIVGRNQNTCAQINRPFVETQGIAVVRRLSGGGAVYHDLGNVNFTFIAPGRGKKPASFQEFTAPILEFLQELGVPAAFDGRNDLSLHGQKISGNAQYVRHGNLLHHGTLLFDTDLDTLEKALRVGDVKYQDRGIPSIRKRVTNIREHLPWPVSADAFMERLYGFIQKKMKARTVNLSLPDREAIERLAQERYRRWEWNYGASPPYNFHKVVKTPAGVLEVCLEVEKGIIHNARIFGDFFGCEDVEGLEAQLVGLRHDVRELTAFLQNFPVSLYIQGLFAHELAQALT